MGKNYVHIFRDLLGKIENPGKTFNADYKCYHLTEHFDTTLLVC